MPETTGRSLVCSLKHLTGGAGIITTNRRVNNQPPPQVLFCLPLSGKNPSPMRQTNGPLVEYSSTFPQREQVGRNVDTI